jgi:prepilin peptidase CpaA
VYPSTVNNGVLKKLVADTIIVVVSGLSAFFDFRIRRIPNWLIASGLLCGVTLNAVQGYSHLVGSVLGFTIGIAVLILPFAFGWIGAGDVKFFGVIGALLGISWLPRVFFYSALIAGVIAVGYLAIGLASFSRLKAFWLDIKAAFLSLGRVMPDPVYIRSRESGSVPWGVAFAAGTIIAYYIDPTGRWAGF